MNKSNYYALLNSDDILDNFMCAIIKEKAEAIALRADYNVSYATRVKWQYIALKFFETYYPDYYDDILIKYKKEIIKGDKSRSIETKIFQ